ncbi:MAG: ABC transporter permease [Tumebacillaceae bacterium]
MGTIAKLAFKETLYKRIFLITFLMTLAFLVFYGVVMHFASTSIPEGQVGDPQMTLQMHVMTSELLGVGLFFANFICVLMTIISGSASVASEIESHQIDTLLARPLRRRDLIFGKFIGLGGLLLVYTVFLFGSLLLMNQMFGGALRYDLSFVSVLQALSVLAVEPLILLTVALWLSSRMTTINSGIIMIVLYGVSFIGGFMEQIAVMIHNTTLTNVGIVSSLIFPIDSVFRKATMFLFQLGEGPLALDRIGPFGSVSEPSAAMMVYAFLYALLFLWLATRRFGKRDL